MEEINLHRQNKNFLKYYKKHKHEFIPKFVLTKKPEPETYIPSTMEHTCEHCSKKWCPKTTTEKWGKVVCPSNKRHNKKTLLCPICYDKYNFKKHLFYTKPCFVCNATHTPNKNWNECNLCLNKAEKTITINCPKKQGLEKITSQNKKQFVKRHFCNECINKWNIRTKGCPFCRQNHEWDDVVLKTFPFQRIIAFNLQGMPSLPLFLQNLNQIIGSQIANLIEEEMIMG